MSQDPVTRIKRSILPIHSHVSSWTKLIDDDKIQIPQVQSDNKMKTKNERDLVIEVASSTRLLSKKSFDEIGLGRYDRLSREDADLEDRDTVLPQHRESLGESCSSRCSTYLRARRQLTFCQVVIAALGVLLLLLVATVVMSEQSSATEQSLISSSTSHLIHASKTRLAAQVQHYTWTIDEIQSAHINRTVFGCNGRMPGPSIEADLGDTVYVQVKNNVKFAITLHWHGLSLQHDNDQDGVAAVTQYGILPGETFEYHFHIDRAGTFWWHAHGGTARLEGLYGAIVVHPTGVENVLSSEVLNSLSDVTVFVGDWYENSTDSYIEEYLSSDNLDLIEPKPTALLVNGQPSETGTLQQTFTVPRHLETSRYWKLRFINVGAIAEVRVQAPRRAGSMTILEADSNPIKAINVASMNVAVGQRYSILIDTDDYEAGEPVTIDMSLDTSTHSLHHHHHHHTSGEQLRVKHALLEGLHHLDAHGSDMRAQDASSMSFFDASTHNLSSIHLHDGMLHPSTGLPDKNVTNRAQPALVVLELGAMRSNNFTRSTINNISYVAANHPILQQFLTQSKSFIDSGLNQKYSPDILTLSVKQGDELLILFNNTAGGNHPMHIHGHQMQLLATDTFFFDPLDPTNRPSRPFDPAAGKSLLNATPETGGVGIERDTVNVGRWALVKIQGLGRGVWALHCHSTWHEISGMVMILEVT